MNKTITMFMARLCSSVLLTNALFCGDMMAFNQKIIIKYIITTIRLAVIILDYAWISWSYHGKHGNGMPWHICNTGWPHPLQMHQTVVDVVNLIN